MRLDINYKKKTVKITNTWRLNNTLLNNQEITEEIKEEIKKYLEGFPGGAVVENLPANARAHGFELWSGKIPHAAERLVQ